MSSSPSTRFDGNDIDGLKEDELEYPKKFLQVIWLPIRVYPHSQLLFFRAPFQPTLVHKMLPNVVFVYASSSMRLLNNPPRRIWCAPALCREQGEGRGGRVGGLLGQPPYRCDSAASDLRTEVRRVTSCRLMLHRANMPLLARCF